MSILLPDFLSFEPFNRLRVSMNATELGHFELFDPNLHLTGEERSLLAKQGIEINHTALQHLLDFTLVFKNSRVIVIDEDCFHIACCVSLPKKPMFQVATELVKATGQRVCSDCLKILHYKGYDPIKARKEAYSRQILMDFKLSEYKSKYPFYPVSEKRELRKPIR